MELSVDDPIFVIDLSDETMQKAREALDEDVPMVPASELSEQADRHLRAVALVFDWSDDPVLLAMEPTNDLKMLDALARLMRFALLTGHSIARLVTEHGDDEMKRMFFARRFPRFVYRGIPVSVRKRLPKELVEAMGRS